MQQSISAQDSSFQYWKDPDIQNIGDTAVEFLNKLHGPTHIHISGNDPSRCRAVVTLLHGNEPSGFHAIFDPLKRQIKPVVDIHYFIPSVDAAKQAPGFIYRMLPHQKDLNRCFSTPFGDTEQDLLAQDLLENLKSFNPESVIDIHNTSGSSPSFGVTTFMDERHDALVSLFTHRTIVTDLPLGSLMEISRFMMPTVTIECGGAQDIASNVMAIEGLTKYISYANVLTLEHTDMSLEFFHNPLRLELLEGSDIAYGDHCLMTDGVTLLPEIEDFNFGFVNPDTRLGFVSGELDSNLTVRDARGRERLQDYFRLSDGELYPLRTLKLFMVTTNPEIARKDCLFYLIEEPAD
ncbi:MAG: succinylglutamate desuccinylase/aspartoacylase family protein [Proteobacteria bacterium]|nr:succinylglutamate desuccinylase/aspartoacylase family protein [Pseudomonadota bacterium]